MSNRTVVRNEAYQKGAFRIRERHNERKNENYDNADIMPEQSHNNVHFKQCPTTYEKEFNRKVREKEISLRGLRSDANVFDVMVFDVNTAYFEKRGGYEYAKAFFAEAYKLAVKEAGGEQYILSAVMHADERNKALSEELGRDVYHYHLHVVYIPVVDKEVRWTKRCKDPALVGTVKEVVKQVSHSKKWPRIPTADCWFNSYSLLQDRFYEHMVEAGYTGFDRGERDSTAQHLSALDYKIKKDEAKVAFLSDAIQQKERRLAGLEKRMAVTHKAARTYGEIEQMGRKTKNGKVVMEQGDWNEVRSLCKEGIAARGTVPDLKWQLEESRRNTEIYRGRWEALSEETEDYRKAKELAPERLQGALDSLFQQCNTPLGNVHIVRQGITQPER